MDPFTIAIYQAFGPIAFILENLRHWMGAFLALFNIDESPLSATIWIAIVALSGIFWCAAEAHEFCKSIPSVRPLVPPTVPASDEALGVVWLLGHRAVTNFYGSSLYGLLRKVWDWAVPEDPADRIGRIISTCILGPILYFTLAGPYYVLKGLVAGFFNVQQTRSPECHRLERLSAHGFRQTRAERRSLYMCEGELYGFDLQDLWEEVEDHPCLNGDIFHRAVLIVAAVLVGVFLLGFIIQEGAPIGGSMLHEAVEGKDGTVECKDAVPQAEPGHVQEAETVPDNSVLQKPTPESTKVETPERAPITPAKSQLEATQENRTGERVVERGVPRRPNAATPQAESTKREDRLSQQLKETEDQLAIESTTRSLAEHRLAAFLDLAGVVADKELCLPLDEFRKLEAKCKQAAGSNTQESRLGDLRGICYSEIPQLLERVREMTLESQAKKTRERIAQSSAMEELERKLKSSTKAEAEQSFRKVELERKLESSTEIIKSLQGQLENRPVPEPLPEPEKLASAKLEEMSRQYDAAVDAIKAEHSQQLISCSSWNQKLEADIQEAKAFFDSVIAAKDQEIAARSKDIGDKDQVIQRQLEIILEWERDAADSRVRADQIAEDSRKWSQDAVQALRAQADANTRAEGAEANVASLQKAYEASQVEIARLRKEKDASTEEDLQKLQLARQELILLREASGSKEADYQQQISDLKSEVDKLLGETKKLRKNQHQAGLPTELQNAKVKILELEVEVDDLKGKLQQTKTPTRDDRALQLVEQLRKKVQDLEREKTEQMIRSSKKVKDLEEELRQKTIALSNASPGGRKVNPRP